MSGAERVAAALLRDRALPSEACYLLPAGARSWAALSETSYLAQRRFYEAAAWSALGGPAWFRGCRRPGELAVVGCGVGHGLGEIELLSRLVADPAGPRVLYWATDTSEILLGEHLARLRAALPGALGAGRLRVASACADILRLKSVIDLPPEVPVLATAFGNTLGIRPGLVMPFMKQLERSFGRRPRALLAGIGVAGRQPCRYPAEAFEFFLETLRALAAEGALRAGPGEFTAAPGRLNLPVARGAHRLKASGPRLGDVYRLRYRLSFPLGSPAVADALPAGTWLTLVSAVLFDPSALLRQLRAWGYGAAAAAPIMPANGREYAVVAAFSGTLASGRVGFGEGVDADAGQQHAEQENDEAVLEKREKDALQLRPDDQLAAAAAPADADVHVHGRGPGK
ncbi:MAG: hypothetical protein HYZ75_05030 [Elusimicrobia bacterium]|nr:hypothetical protein [Elusimicrobiota bacterium]